MEKWLVDNIGTVLTIISLVIGLAVSYANLKASITELQARLSALTADFEKLRNVGVPFVCPIHQKRLDDMEAELKRQTTTISSDIVEIKGLVEANHDLIVTLQREKHLRNA